MCLQITPLNIWPAHEQIHPSSVEDIKKIYEVIKSDIVSLNQVSEILGYKKPNTEPFYKRLNSLIAFGFLYKEGRGRYGVTELGKEISYLKNENDKADYLRRAFMTVPLWKELYRIFKNEPSESECWWRLAKITAVESPDAKKVSNEVRKWYLEDVALISDEDKQKSIEIEKTNKFSSGSEYISGDNEDMKQLEHSKSKILKFDEYTIIIPKNETLEEAWETLKDYVAIKLKKLARQKSNLPNEYDKEKTNPETTSFSDFEIQDNEIHKNKSTDS